jgi:hypothetical protein
MAGRIRRRLADAGEEVLHVFIEVEADAGSGSMPA